MKLQRLISTVLAASSVFLFVNAATVIREDSTEPEIVAAAEFPESNAFGLVVNGERNSLTVTIENKSERDVTLVNIAGSLHLPDKDVLVKNLTAVKIGLPLAPNAPVRLPYAFHSEFKPGDLRLHIWVESSVDDKKFQVTAYDSVVQIVEPEASFFDYQTVSTYLIVLAIIGGVSYYTFLSLAPQTKKPRSKAAQPSTPVSAVATGAGGYEEEWIPEHHLKKTRAGKKQKQSAAVSGTSGDDHSGAETSGAEGKRRKGRK